MGTRLDEVDGFELNGVHFVPAKLSRVDQNDELRLAAALNNTPAGSLEANEKLMASVELKDGRVLNLQTTVEPPGQDLRFSKSVQAPGAASALRLGATTYWHRVAVYRFL